MVAADLNGDGRIDLAVANLDSNDVSILLGIGDGTFQPPIRVAVGAAPSDLIAGDLNRDGFLELAVACSMSNEVDFVGYVPGRGFQMYDSEPTGVEPGSLAEYDYNGDGLLDLIVANRSSGNLTMMIGTPSGRLFEQTLSWPGMIPSSFVLLHLSSNAPDGLLVVDPFDKAWVMLAAGGQPGFLRIDLGIKPGACAMADFDGDGNLDLAIADPETRLLVPILIRSYLGLTTLGLQSFSQGLDLARLAIQPGSPIKVLPRRSHGSSR